MLQHWQKELFPHYVPCYLSDWKTHQKSLCVCVPLCLLQKKGCFLMFVQISSLTRAAPSKRPIVLTHVCYVGPSLSQTWHESHSHQHNSRWVGVGSCLSPAPLAELAGKSVPRRPSLTSTGPFLSGGRHEGGQNRAQGRHSCGWGGLGRGEEPGVSSYGGSKKNPNPWATQPLSTPLQAHRACTCYAAGAVLRSPNGPAGVYARARKKYPLFCGEFLCNPRMQTRLAGRPAFSSTNYDCTLSYIGIEMFFPIQDQTIGKRGL